MCSDEIDKSDRSVLYFTNISSYYNAITLNLGPPYSKNYNCNNDNSENIQIHYMLDIFIINQILCLHTLFIKNV